MITLTVVRHGESTDNLKSCWAGWANAPLSNHGMNQAKALGESYKQTKVDHIYASDLLRALWTAQQIERQQSEPKPTFTVSELLREQFFGEAEQQPFGEKGGYERKPGRQFRFPGGETLEDVRARANRGIAAYIEQHLQANKGKGPMSAHVVVVAHGIFNSEFIGALLARRGTSAPLQWGYKGMTNTGWTRLEVGYADEAWSDPNPSLETDPDEPQPPSSRPTEPPPKQPLDTSAPKLAVKILCTDITTHLERVHRQKGGIGSQGFDQKQTDLRAFFAGASTDK